MMTILGAKSGSQDALGENGPAACELAPCAFTPVWKANSTRAPQTRAETTHDFSFASQSSDLNENRCHQQQFFAMELAPDIRFTPRRCTRCRHDQLGAAISGQMFG